MQNAKGKMQTGTTFMKTALVGLILLVPCGALLAADNGLTMQTYYRDLDGDGYGQSTSGTKMACSLAVAGPAPAAARRALVIYFASSVVCGVAAYRDVWTVARNASDRWLSDTRLLIQEAAARSPERLSRITPRDFATMIEGHQADLVRGDSVRPPLLPRRRWFGNELRATVTARIGPGRWMELRSEPGEAGVGGWLPLLVGIALVGPLSGLARHYYRHRAVEQEPGPQLAARP